MIVTKLDGRSFRVAGLVSAVCISVLVAREQWGVTRGAAHTFVPEYDWHRY